MSAYHDMLVSAYMFNKFLYKRSFTERIKMDLDIVCYSPSFYSEEIDALLDKELEEKINSLKKPWWNGIYKRISKHETLLLLIYVLFLRRPDRHTLKILYKMLTAKGHK